MICLNFKKTFIVFYLINALLIQLSFTSPIAPSTNSTFNNKSNLLEITEENYDEIINNTENILIFFYTNPCPICKQIFPVLEKAYNLLTFTDLVVKIGSVNCKENPQIKRRLNMDNSFALKFISNGNPMNYTGGRTSEQMVTWMREMLGPSIGEVSTAKEIEELKDIVKNLLVFFGSASTDEKLFSIFLKVTRHNAKNIDVIFINCPKKECLEYYNVKNGNVILFKKYDERKNEFKKSDYTVEELQDFLTQSSKPSVMNFDFETANLIFEQKSMPGLFLYRLKKPGVYQDDYFNTLLEIAPFVKGKIQLVISDLVDISETKLADMIGIKQSDLPLVMLHDTRDVLKSYKMSDQNKINKENILKFVEDWEKGDLKRFIKSKDEPKVQNEDSIVLVGTTLEQFIMDNNSKDVVVMFYAPWCKLSKEFMPIYEGLWKKILNSTNAAGNKLIMAKFDAHYNEHTVINLQYYPTVALWRAGNKNEIIEFKLERNEDNLIKFIQTYATYPMSSGIANNQVINLEENKNVKVKTEI